MMNSKYCCYAMRTKIIEKEIKYNPDGTITMYGKPDVHSNYDMTSMFDITFCPFCGKNFYGDDK